MHVLLKRLCMYYCSGYARFSGTAILSEKPYACAIASSVHVLLQRLSGYARLSGTAILSGKPYACAIAACMHVLVQRLCSSLWYCKTVRKACPRRLLLGQATVREGVSMAAAISEDAMHGGSSSEPARKQGCYGTPAGSNGDAWNLVGQDAPYTTGGRSAPCRSLHAACRRCLPREVDRQGERVIRDPLRSSQRYFWPFDATP
jgi:hypothetical protein